MSKKNHYNLSVVVATMAELVHGTEPIHVDVSVYAIQTVGPLVQFTDINNTLCGASKTGNLSDSTSSFILFSYYDPEENDSLRLPVYKSVCSLIGTANGKRSMCICIPAIKDPFSPRLYKIADMAFFVEGVVAGLRDAMKDCTAVIKTNQQVIYFVVPEEMKQPLMSALEKLE